MNGKTICIDAQTHQLLQSMSRECGVPELDVLRNALDSYQIELFFRGLNGDFAVLRAKPEAWAEEIKEREEWEGTLGDGLID